MEGQTFDMEAYNISLDRANAGVMPETWLGHGRITVNESDLSSKGKSFASKLMNRMAEKHPDKPTETLAEKAVEATRKKLS